MGDARVKICGLTSAADLHAAAEAGAAYFGFVFYPPSPRALTVANAAPLTAAAPPERCVVGLFVDPDDAFLAETLAGARIDMIQLHGRESPARVSEIRARFGRPVMKAVAIAAAEDLARLAEYEGAADQLLVDAKPPKRPEDSFAGAALPGGNGLSFDWRLIAGRRWRAPWMLAGGLTAETVGAAVALTGARQVDVSSGVETAPGVKSADKIRAFVAATDRAVAAAGDGRVAGAQGQGGRAR